MMLNRKPYTSLTGVIFKLTNVKTKTKHADAKIKISRRRFIESRGYRVCSIWECEFDQMLRESETIRTYCNQHKRHTEKHENISSQEIVNAVMEDKIFGAVEVDIHVPLHLKEKFSEMSPLFANTLVPYESIGIYTQEIDERLGVSKKPRKLLIGGMRARQILLATPLLKWYIEHGLEVTRLYKLIEYSPNKYFEQFTKDISDARRAGDLDPRLAIIAETNKLIGNSSYGSMLMRKDKHSHVIYC